MRIPDYVTLSDISRLLTKEGYPVKRITPYKWWERSLQGQNITHPMPQPVMYLGGHKSPVWVWDDIYKWFKEWKKLEE